jgi:CAAX prenyl protease-like protein
MSDPSASIPRSSPPPSNRSSPFPDDWSYLLPMGVFVGLTALAGSWPALFPLLYIYIFKTILTAVLLYICWPAFTKIDWSGWKLGILVGIAGIFQWVAMEKLLLHLWPGYPRVHAEVFDPYAEIHNPTLRGVFFIFRWLGPTLVVPFMEELFWRDYLWRTIIAPNDFKLARIGEWDRNAFWLIPLFFASVHIQWMTAVVWALMIGLLLVKTRSLGACIIAHGVTNFLLGAYVLWTHDWYFW